MKYLIRLNKKDNTFVDMQSIQEEYIHKYQDVDELPQKDGYYASYEWDNEKQQVVGKYVAIQKTEVEKLREIVYGLQEQVLSSGIGL